MDGSCLSFRLRNRSRGRENSHKRLALASCRRSISWSGAVITDMGLTGRAYGTTTVSRTATRVLYKAIYLLRHTFWRYVRMLYTLLP